MRTRNEFLLAIVLLFASLVTGCASVPMASMDEDTKAKSFVVRADRSNIYVYRNESIGGAVPMTIALDGKLAGQTAMQTYFLFEVDPGPHELSSVAENTSTLKLNTEAGKAYFIWQEVKMGMWMARSQLQQVDEQTGRKGVAECKRAQSNF
jgi:hypothetical protein